MHVRMRVPMCKYTYVCYIIYIYRYMYDGAIVTRIYTTSLWPWLKSARGLLQARILVLQVLAALLEIGLSTEPWMSFSRKQIASSTMYQNAGFLCLWGLWGSRVGPAVQVLAWICPRATQFRPSVAARSAGGAAWELQVHPQPLRLGGSGHR